MRDYYGYLYEMKDGYPDYGTGEIILTTDLLFDDRYIPEELVDCHWAYVDDGYWISNYGHMYSKKTCKLLTPQELDRLGHLGYKVIINGKREYLYAHRLVAQSFIPNPNDDPIVRHLDDVSTNNDIYNLAWGTQLDNMHDAIRNDRAYYLTDKDREKGFALIRKPTKATNLKTGEVREYRSLNDAARDLGVQQASAQKVVTGKRPHTCGWTFEYINKED